MHRGRVVPTKSAYVGFITVVIVLGGCSDDSSTAEECLRNSDCASPQICLGGKCADECVESRDCASDEVCDNGECVPDSAECGDGQCTSSETCSSCAADCGVCCGDGDCDGSDGENCTTCASDCGCDAGEACVSDTCESSTTCGNSACDGGETCISCPADCGSCCGNGTCDSANGETCSSCPADCGCSGNETCSGGTCVFDVGVSMVWMGTYADATALEAANGPPQPGWAYLNTTDGNVYIYDGSSWTILVAGGGGDAEPPVISGLTVQDGNKDGLADFIWSTNEDSVSQVEYGLTAAYGTQSPWTSPYAQSHTVSLTGLHAATYHFRARSKDAGGNIGETTDSTFIVPLEVDAVGPAENASLVATGSAITITFSDTMDPATLTATNFTVDTDGTPVTGSISSNGYDATFIPTAALPPDATITVTVTTDVQNIVGTPLPSDKVWTFRTADAWTLVATANNNITTMTFDSLGNLYVGGQFSSIGGVGAALAAKWDGSNWTSLGSGLTTSCKDVSADGLGNVYFVGGFGSAGGSSIYRVAKWNGAAWSAVGGGMNDDAFVVVSDPTGKLYVSGYFLGVIGSGVLYSRIAYWNGNAWQVMAAGLNGNITQHGYAMDLDSVGNLYVGGTFPSASGVANTNLIAKWNGTTWSALGTGMNAAVYSIRVDASDNVYAGGNFTTAGGLSAVGIAKWNGSAWSALGSGMNSTVTAIAIDGTGRVLAGGAFTTAGGSEAIRIAVWNGSSWSRLGYSLPSAVSDIVIAADGTVYAASGSRLYRYDATY